MEDNALKSSAHRQRDFFQVANVRLVKLTQEQSMMVKLVLQISVPKDRRSFKMVPARIVQTILDQLVIIKGVHHKFVQPDRSCRLTEDVLSAIHTQELTPKDRLACHIIVTIDKSLDQMDHVLTAQTSREPKEQVLLVDQTHATSDRESKEMVPVSTVSCITLSAPTEDAAQNQLANQWLNISLWMVSVAHVHSTSKQEEMVSHAQLTQPRSFQIHR